jgi:hypothetical protein
MPNAKSGVPVAAGYEHLEPGVIGRVDGLAASNTANSSRICGLLVAEEL